MAEPRSSREENRWFEAAHDMTVQLARLPTVSPSAGEAEVAEVIVRLLEGVEPDRSYRELGLDPLPADPCRRSNAYAFLQGNSSTTLILLGHIDTVGTADYGALQSWAFNPEGLAERQAQLEEMVPGLADDLETQPGDWMFGRGVVDMKSGVAANIAVMRRLAAEALTGRLPLSVVFLATPDEENESAGILRAVTWLLDLRRRYGLDYAGAINTDYTTSLYPGDPLRYIFSGTVGKMLPSFFIAGVEAHAASPFDGCDANLIAAELIRDLSMSDDLCDRLAGQIAPPPVTLHAADLKRGYDVQIPFAAHFSLNVLTLTTRPDELLMRLALRAEASLSRALQAVDESMRRWLIAGGYTERALRLAPRSGRVMTYSQLRNKADSVLGEEAVSQELQDEWQQVPAAADRRERSLRLVHRLWRISGITGPAVILYYAPPFYPHVRASDGPLRQAVSAVAENHPELRLQLREYYPYVSDMSYLRLDREVDVAALIQNMPVWQDTVESSRPGAYSLPLEAMRQLAVPVVNLGPYGRGAHQRGERVLMSYAFGILPQLIYEVFSELATSCGQ